MQIVPVTCFHLQFDTKVLIAPMLANTKTPITRDKHVKGCSIAQCEQALHLEESREVTREQHAKRDVSVKGGPLAINAELAPWLVVAPQATQWIVPTIA